MKSFILAGLALLIFGAVLPEVITGSTHASVTQADLSVRQATGCSGRCFGRVNRANRECRRGILAGNVCRVQRCDRGRPNRGFQCVFVRSAAPSPLPPMAPIGTCPNVCFVAPILTVNAIQRSLTEARGNCANIGPPCIVRTCSSSPFNGYICAQRCPCICRVSEATARQDCSASVRCFVQPCNLPNGATGSTCCDAPAPTPSEGGVVVVPSSSPSGSPSASPSVTPSPSTTPLASPSVTPTPSASATISMTPTPSPSCSFSAGTAGNAPTTAFCRCGTRTETVTIPAAVDDLGMALTIPNEVTGRTNYNSCISSDLAALCTPNDIDVFSSRGATVVNNCCTRSVVDGMGLSTVTNQCRIGDGCGPITTLQTTALIGAVTITCTCSGTPATVDTLALTENVPPAGSAITAFSPAQAPIAEMYRTCVQTSVSALCTSSGFSSFSTMGATAVSTCCMDTTIGVSGTLVTASAPNTCDIS